MPTCINIMSTDTMTGPGHLQFTERFRDRWCKTWMHYDLAGFCFCYFKNRDEATACIEDFDDRECQELTDQRLRVEFARVMIHLSHC